MSEREYETCEHNGETYTETDGVACVEYVEDRVGKYRGEIDYKYMLTEAHEGPPIYVWLTNVRDESDEGTWRPAYDKMLWVNDETEVPDFVSEGYNDTVLDDIMEIFMESRD